MLELARDLLPLLHGGAAVAAVTITRVARSAPRGPGATMAVTADGRVLGSISGGCVEGDAVVLAHGARVGGSPLTARLGFSDDAAHAAGLACGGSVDVVAYRLPAAPAVMAALEAVAAGRGVTVGVVLGGSGVGRVLDEGELRTVVASGAAGSPRDQDGSRRAGAEPSHAGPHLEALIAHRETGVVGAAVEGADILVLSHAPTPRLLIVGAGEHAAALCRIATAAGFAVTVLDVWDTLVTRDRFPAAVALHAGLPHELLAAIDPATLDTRSAVCVLTHDERLDVPALAAALSMPVGFVGAMGARSTVARRAELLLEAGVAAADIARIHSPLGLDLGGASPSETAISVLAEIVAARYGGSTSPLRGGTGPLHRRERVGADIACDTAGVPAAAPACGIPHPTGAQ